MPGRIIEIGESNRYLSLKRGFMVISHRGGELARVPLDDLAAVIASGHGTTHSSNLLAALAERGVPFVLCAGNHLPVGMLLSVDGHFQQAKRIDAQLTSRRPQRKRLWQTLVRAKLQMQAAALRSLGRPHAPLSALAIKVRSGDPENVEAQGARRYWNLLFGNEFRRDRNGEDHNRLLNYGYTVLRSAVARSVIAAGLHPSLGLHHHNSYNAMRLVDDLMEPFRPLVDLRVHALVQAERLTLDTQDKGQLARLLFHDLETAAGTTPVISCLQRLAVSLAQHYLGECRTLDLPLLKPLPDLTVFARLP
ncbi:MAG: type II CRISPR-associated endonuclease Cas1 [Candidatus Thiodiazotropha endolucinida]|nr:type II CRISPR-associated endonuclease Cas1 [Candidatus Thiodiazotropha sp. (ex. Lucinisca nassula)]PUB86464.1 MAG: type II CRISPR-associated endonuclease Cas1 [gamma proteobacterium symbiont of Ctena orbiculata]